MIPVLRQLEEAVCRLPIPLRNLIETSAGYARTYNAAANALTSKDLRLLGDCIDHVPESLMCPLPFINPELNLKDPGPDSTGTDD